MARSILPSYWQAANRGKIAAPILQEASSWHRAIFSFQNHQQRSPKLPLFAPADHRQTAR
ncbi:hypothetical protein [Leptolyngbya sp. FACHB-261]|uniref:hypothetical protein n=1 Tax=Leptolyngbya sp. FACHB-261 TaxID=2692806 RepID=UPI00168277E8|nr:hypothetical protein [Leptolyngbya sp. FACHB-261]